MTRKKGKKKVGRAEILGELRRMNTTMEEMKYLFAAIARNTNHVRSYVLERDYLERAERYVKEDKERQGEASDATVRKPSYKRTEVMDILTGERTHES